MIVAAPFVAFISVVSAKVFVTAVCNVVVKLATVVNWVVVWVFSWAAILVMTFCCKATICEFFKPPTPASVSKVVVRELTVAWMLCTRKAAAGVTAVVISAS